MYRIDRRILKSYEAMNMILFGQVKGVKKVDIGVQVKFFAHAKMMVRKPRINNLRPNRLGLLEGSEIVSMI